MHIARTIGLAVLSIWLFAVPARPGTAAVPAPVVDVPDLVAALVPSVVNIAIVRYETPVVDASAKTARASTARRRSVGSGFVIDPAGLILTNRHVIENAAEITVTFSDGTSLGATVVTAAAVVDLAVLRVKSDKPLAAVRWGDSFTLRQGMPVIAIGNPLGYSCTVTMGIISALDRDIKSSSVDHFIQTDASINPGNSGGPLFNLKGEVIGVNTAISTTSQTSGSIGIGFAIPSNDAQFVVNRLMQFDRVKLGWLALKVQKPSEAVAEAVGLDTPKGVIVTSVDPSRPALTAAIWPGDVILDIDGEQVRDARTFNRAVGVQIVGSKAPLRIWRDGGEKVVMVAIEDSPEDLRRSMIQPGLQAASLADPPDLGLSLAALSDEVRAQMKLPDDQAGVVVVDVHPFSKAAEQGMETGDVILKVHRARVASVREFWSKVDQARSERQSRILLLIRSADEERWVAVPTK